MTKFFKNVVTVTVLSEDAPINPDSLADVHDMITIGDCSGDFNTESTEVSPKEMADLLTKQGSDPAFFQLEDLEG